MTLSTAAIIYYIIATPLLLLMCKMMYVGGRDEKRPITNDSPKAVGNISDTNAYNGRLIHTMNDVGIDGTEEDLKRMLNK